MNKSLLSRITNKLNEHKNKSIYKRIFICLASIVFITTIYILMKPAITMEEVLICNIDEHTHTEECYEEKFICTEETGENLNNESCYEKTLIHQEEEHTHTEDCYVTTSDKEDIDYLTNVIEKLPTVDEMNNHIKELSTKEEQEEYREEIIATATNAYSYYLDLNEKVQSKITNISKLLEYEEEGLIKEENNSIALLDEYTPYGVATIAEDDNSLDVLTASDGVVSTSEFIELNLYDYGSNINANYKSNNKHPGFQWNGGAYYNSDYSRHSVDYIDFGNSMITDFTYGTASSNNAKSKNAIKIASTTGANGAINKIDNSSYGITNRPIGMSLNDSIDDTDEDVLSRTLGSDGYPALTDGTSLKYLFSSGTYATKKNTASVDGLFLQNSTTGEYHYNSRENHAQYSNNKFTLYKQIITPNFIVYPFGNFLPFNDIKVNTNATQVGSINNIGSYITQIRSSLSDSNTTEKQLKDMLKKYYDSLDDDSLTSISAKRAILDYFTGGEVGADDTSPITDSLVNKMYNINWNIKTNFFFGMEMKMNFMQPRNGQTGIDGKQDMRFYFTGDDDVWVYIDDVLFLDLSGIHRHVGGEIDFVNGKVHYYYLDSKGTGDVSTTPYKTYTFKEILESANKSVSNINSKGTFKDYTTHSFKFYYMERGSGSSVCRLNFNFPLLKQNSITLTKELSVDEGTLDSLGNPDFMFQVLKAEGSTKGDDLFITSGTKYEIYKNYETNREKIGEGTVDDNGIIKLKSGQTAVFEGIEEDSGKYYVREILDEDWVSQYKEVIIDGKETTTDTYVETEIDSNTFAGFESTIKDISDGSTAFIFNNNIETNKYGKIEITKELKGIDSDELFKFQVKFDDDILPIGTKYTVIKYDGEKTITEERIIEEDSNDNGVGYILLAKDETAIIDKILAGSNYEVKEITTAINGYEVKYNGEDVNKVSGIITSKEVVEIMVTNISTGTDIVIPITKKILNPDGLKHSYNFKLTEMTGSSKDAEIVENGEVREITIEDITDEKTLEEAFKLEYARPNYDEGETNHYYKIEEVTDTDSNTKYDDSIYIIKVTVINTEDNFNVRVTKVYKDYKYITEFDDDGNVINEIEFINSLLVNLTINKEVQGNVDDSGEFEFEIEIIDEGEPIIGEYSYRKTTITNEVETFNDMEIIRFGEEQEELKENTTVEEGTIIFNEDGKSIITLSHNEVITIYGMPYDAKYKITELNTNGYVVTHSINQENEQEGYEVNGSLDSDNTNIKFINIGGYMMPDTGGNGSLIYGIIGLLLLIVPVIYIGYSFYKHERSVV